MQAASQTKDVDHDGLKARIQEYLQKRQNKSADSVAKIGLSLCLRSETRFRAEYLEFRGIAFDNQDLADSSSHYYDKASALYRKIGDKPAAIRCELGKLEYLRRIAPEKTLEAYLRLVPETKSLEDKTLYRSLLTQIHILHYGLGNHEESGKIVRELLADYRSAGDSSNVANMLYSLGNRWFERDKDSAQYYYNLALVNVPTADNRLPVYILQAYGGLMRPLDLDKSWKLLQKADSINRLYNVDSPQLPLIRSKSEFLLGRTRDAVNHALYTYRSTEKNNYLFLRMDAAESLSKYYKKLGKLDSAMYYLEDYTYVKDSIRSGKAKQETAKLAERMKYEEVLRENAIAEKEKEMSFQADLDQQKVIRNVVIIILCLILLSAIIIAGAYIRNRRLSQSISEKNQRLEDLDKVNKQVFSVISHDLHGPLLSMRLMLENSAVETNGHAEDVRNQLIQSEAILANLLNWSKSELLANDETSKMLTSVSPIVDTVIEQLRSATDTKNVQIKNLVPADFRLAVPADLLLIVFRNLLGNAVKFSYPDSSVECGVDEARLICFIRDFGVGIEDKQKEKIFDRQLQPKLGTTHETGFGLGLYLTSELIKKYGGQIWVESQPGNTVFFFDFGSEGVG